MLKDLQLQQIKQTLLFVKTIDIDKTVVNQCQGFTYDPTSKRFILACCNADNSKQRIYELDMDMNVVKFTDFEGIDKLGHVNTLFYGW